MITSAGNKQLKNIRLLLRSAKARRDQKLFVIEGEKLVDEAPAESIEALYVAGRAAKYAEAFLAKVSSFKKSDSHNFFGSIEQVRDDIFDSISGTVTPQGIMAVVKMPEYSLEDVAGEGFSLKPHQSILQGETAADQTDIDSSKILYLLLDDIKDPGNLGTILRTAEAAGVRGVFMSEECADIFNPKVVRSTMGSIFRVRFCSCRLTEAIKLLKGKGCDVYAAELNGSLRYDEITYGTASAFVIGNEAKGVRAEIVKAAENTVRIPMAGRVESLNAAVSAAVLLFNPGIRTVSG